MRIAAGLAHELDAVLLETVLSGEDTLRPAAPRDPK